MYLSTITPRITAAASTPAASISGSSHLGRCRDGRCGVMTRGAAVCGRGSVTPEAPVAMNSVSASGTRSMIWVDPASKPGAV
jgi:hypothetical protein